MTISCILTENSVAGVKMSDLLYHHERARKRMLQKKKKIATGNNGMNHPRLCISGGCQRKSVGGPHQHK
jgi:hypothetical protein